MSRLIREKHILRADFNALRDSFVVVYAGTDNVFIYDGRGLDSRQRVEFIRHMISEVQTVDHVARKIVAQSKNIYYVY